MDKFNNMTLVSGTGIPLSEGRFVMHHTTEYEYIVFDEIGTQLAAFNYETRNEKSQDKALEDAISVCFPGRS